MDVAPWAYKWTDWMGWMTQIQTDKETEMEKDIDQNILMSLAEYINQYVH